MKTINTEQDKNYVLTAVTVPVTVKAILDDGSTVTLLNTSKTGQFGFVAVSSKIQVSQDNALVALVRGFNGALSGTSSGGGVTCGDGLTESDGELSVDQTVVRTNHSNIVNGPTSFTQPVNVGDATSAGHAATKGQLSSETISWLMKKGVLNNTGTWGYMKDWDYNTLAAPCPLHHFVRGETYFIDNVDTPNAIPPSRLVLSTSSTDTGWKPYLIPSISFFPIVSEVWGRYNLKIGLGFNVAATASCPQTYDEYQFPGTWVDIAPTYPSKWWADIQFKNDYNQPERIRVMTTPPGSPANSNPVLVTKTLNIPSNAKITGLVFLANHQNEGDKVSRAAICALDSTGTVYRLHDFEGGVYWTDPINFTLSLFVSKPESGWKTGSRYTIKGPVRIYNAANEAISIYKNSIIAYSNI